MESRESDEEETLSGGSSQNLDDDHDSNESGDSEDSQ